MDAVYLLAPLLSLAVVLAAVWLDRWSVPVILVALGLGIVFGSDVLGVWNFANAAIANNLANTALVFILFQGGLATKRQDFKAVALPAGGMATWGVILTAAATYGVLHWGLGWAGDKAVLLAVVISSTDAAATFSILHRHSLPRRLSSTLEIESAANDPMAILLTLVVVEGLATGASAGWMIVPLFMWKFLAGPIVGWLMARAAVAIFNGLNPQDRGHYYVVLIAMILLTYGVAEQVQVSGMLAVFTAGLVMGNRRVIYQQGIRNFSAALSTIANIGMFTMMGLLVFPRQWSSLWVHGIILFLVLTFVARPAAVWLGTLGMRLGARERIFMAWAGLRGAVPIVLATYPMAAGVQVGEEVFNLVFFAVLLSVSFQGSTLGWLATGLRLSQPSQPQPRYGLELVTMAHSDMDLVVVAMPGPQGRPGPRIRELVLPPGALIVFVTRGGEVVAPSGNTRLLGWDHVTVLARVADEDEIRATLLQPFEHPLEPHEPMSRLLDAAPPAGSHPVVSSAPASGHVVLIGHGRVGAVIAGFLKRRDLPFVIIEQDRTIVASLQRSGERVVASDGSDPEALERARIADARLLLITSTETVAARRAIEHAQRINPRLEVVARVHNDAQRAMLSALPNTSCVQGEVELAYAMAQLMLQALGVSVIEAEASIMDARLGRSDGGARRTRVTEIHVPPDSPVIGRTLKDMGLPRDALIVTIARAGEFVVPSGETQVLADDALLVLADMVGARAIERIVREPSPAA